MVDQPNASRFSIEATAVIPAPGMTLPNNLCFSLDNARLLYLLGTASDAAQQLWALETATGVTALLLEPLEGGIAEDALSLAEVLRRQRVRSRATGITSYARAERSERILVPLRDGLYMVDGLVGSESPARRIVAGEDLQMPALSPDGERVAYVRDGEVYVAAVDVGAPETAPRQITRGGRETGVTHGLAEYVAQEELDRREGFWWSPDGQWIAFAEVDERHIPLYIITHQGKETTGPETREEHRYPFVGAENARVRLGVVSVADGGAESGAPVWMELDFGEEVYVARVFWWLDGDLGAVVVNRPQKALWLVRFDRATGQRTIVMSEQRELWINVPTRGMIQLTSGAFVWASERSGFRHLYLCDRSGMVQRQLTAGEWMVDDLLAVDEAGGFVYFTGNRDDPREKQFYAAPIAGGDLRRITHEPGMHEVVIDSACTLFADTWSALDRPPMVTLRRLSDGVQLQTLPLPADPRIEAFRLEPPELVTLRNREGDTLYGALYRPDPAVFGSGPYPTIVSVYGGPQAQEVTNSWGRMTASMNLQYLRGLGFLIFALDNRGSARRGLRFEGALARHFGSVEVDDQVDGVHWLVEQGLADPRRVGITGWSYGGYMTLMCLAKAPDVFTVAVAGAPVTDFAGYDTAYTERYLETPATNADGYLQTSVLTHVSAIRGKLLLIHGMLDENVHFRHSARLLNALIQVGNPVDTLFFPDERHMLRFLPDRVYLNERIAAYFLAHL
jgi:dipeptidyl-peptidase-4